MRFAIDRAGLVGADGATHAGSFDITYLASLPNFVVMAAADEAELAGEWELADRLITLARQEVAQVRARIGWMV